MLIELDRPVQSRKRQALIDDAIHGEKTRLGGQLAGLLLPFLAVEPIERLLGGCAVLLLLPRQQPQHVPAQRIPGRPERLHALVLYLGVAEFAKSVE